jgi:hypothetical protein
MLLATKRKATVLDKQIYSGITQNQRWNPTNLKTTGGIKQIDCPKYNQ